MQALYRVFKKYAFINSTFFLYYALPKFNIHLEQIPPLDLICLSVEETLRPSFACAIVGLSFLGGSYMAESLRAGFEAIRKQQFEAGLSLGFSKLEICVM